MAVETTPSSAWKATGNPRCADGSFRAVPTGPLTRRRLPFSVVAKPTGAACNLDCQYCFFLSKELLYSSKRQQMSDQTLAAYVAEYLAARRADIAWTAVFPHAHRPVRALSAAGTACCTCDADQRHAHRQGMG